mgnify:FL=1
MTTQTGQSQANFNQPQSLVKYSNPVLVSTAGKKQSKVLSYDILGKNKSTKLSQHLHLRYTQFYITSSWVHNRKTATLVPIL